MRIPNQRFEEWIENLGFPLLQIKISNSFLAARKVDNIVYVSSATPLKSDGTEIIGKIGQEVDLLLAKEAACLCLVHSLSLLQSVVKLPIQDRLDRVIDLTFMMNCSPDFGKHSFVADAASDLLIEYFGEKGKHSRSAIGVGSLVRNCCMVVKGMYELKN